ncbi:hypothetical protein HYT26_04205 [Candidatus Pacearchaeota archaeon]|nr:hypothetical protein [Candidatus Pacearchaeota archaeon]
MKRNFNKLFLIFAAFLIFAFSINLASAIFQFNGTATDENGIPLNNSVVNITIRTMAGWTVVNTNSTTTNASGWFNLSVDNSSALYIYEISITHKNLTWLGNNTNSAVDFISKTIPPFPTMMIQIMAGANFYLTPAGTINISAFNSSQQSVTFNYQIKDTKLGYPIASNFDSYVSEAVVYVPSGRNYSIMMYPNQSMPVNLNWNNFSTTSSYNLTLNSTYNATTKTLIKKFNLTLSMTRVFGFFNYSVNMAGNISSWNNLTVVPYLMEPGSMVHAQFGAMPYDLSSAVGQSDVYDMTRGFFNISLPATAETSDILLFASAMNGSLLYGGFANISLPYGTLNRSINFTVFGLFGSQSNITMNTLTGTNRNITTAKYNFFIVNGSNATQGNLSVHAEIKVNYSAYNATSFTWIYDVPQAQAITNLTIPLLNATGITEMNVYISGGSPGGSGSPAQFAPRRVSFTQAQLRTNLNNITASSFNPRAIDNNVGAGSVTMELYYSNATCDVPNPPSTCLLGGSQNMQSFNPIRAVMGGGKLSFRMGTGSVLIHYVNVDLIASGPPDVLFDAGTNTNGTSGSTFAAAMRFGSAGPSIYDYALTSIPYTETAGSGLNESTTINISIPLMYDDDWNVIWNTTANGTSASALAGNFSHYSERQSEWANLTALTNCINTSITTSSQINASTPCYVDMANNVVWVRIPHFSGTGPSVGGSALAASTTAATSSGGGGSVGTTSFWKNTIAITTTQSAEGYTKEIAVKDRIKVQIDVPSATVAGGTSSEAHYVGVVSLDTTAKTVTINISSTPQQATFSVGDEKKFEVTDDTFYDLSVKLNSINVTTSKVNIAIKSIHEEMPKVLTPSSNATGNVTAPPATGAEEEQAGEKANQIWLWIVIAVIIIVAIILIIVGSFYKKKRYSKKGY